MKRKKKKTINMEINKIEGIKEKIIDLELAIKTIIPNKTEAIKTEDRKNILRQVSELVGIGHELIGALKESRNENARLLNKIIENEWKQHQETNKNRKDEQMVTYASKLKASTNHKVVLESSTENADTIKEMIWKKIDPVASKIEINQMKKTKRGGLIIECNTEEQKARLKTEIQANMKKSIKIKDLLNSKPRIIYRNINENVKEEELPHILYRQNEKIANFYTDFEDFEKEVEVIFSYKKKDKKYKNIILEVTNKARQILSQENGIVWQKRQAEDYIHVRKCFRCQGFGHTANNCTEIQDTCGICAKKHKTNLCETKDEKACINCIKNNEKGPEKYPINHTTMDPQCPAKIKRISILKQYINYED